MNPSGELKQVALTDILLSPTNPRKTYRTPDWPDFVASIHTQGVIEPGIARPHPKLKGRFELVAGSRRFLGSQEAARPTMPIIIRDLTDDQVVEIQQIENLQRENLSALEEAEGYQSWIRALQKANEEITVEDAVLRISGRVHRKRSAIFARLALLKTSAPVQEALAKGRLDPSAASLIATVPDPAGQAQLLKQASELSVRELAGVIAEEYRQPLKGAPFDLADTKLGISKTGGRIFGGACTDCPHRTGNMVDRYPELAKTPQVCTSPECYRLKVAAHTDALLSRAKAEGRRILGAKEYASSRYNGGYEEPDRRCWEDKKDRTYGQLAKAAKILPIVTVNYEGEVIEVFNRSDLAAIRAFHKIKNYSSGRSGPSKAELARARRQRLVDDATTAAVVAAVERQPMTTALWQTITAAALDCAWHDRVREMARRRKLGVKGYNAGSQLAKLAALASEGSCRGYLVELLVAQGLRSWSGPDKYFKRTLQILKINPKAIARKVAAEQTAKAKSSHKDAKAKRK